LATKDWDRYVGTAKVLVVGHDPRLQKSNTMADFCFFANYYFDQVDDPQYLKKRALAKSVFEFVGDISGGKYRDPEIYITNLCNDPLPSAPKGKTVYIPNAKALQGLEHIRDVLYKTNIEVIFAMSEQVNYWLQELGFYDSQDGYRNDAKPKRAGTESHPRYYAPSVNGCFKKICGNEYKADNRHSIFPILHFKNYPPEGRFLTYRPSYDRMRTTVSTLKMTHEGVD
jgi:hypothetical protein